jgi:SHS family sialic acid transporter-like MFS transporter
MEKKTDENKANGGALRPTGKWMVLIAAFLGWMFDGFEMGLFPLIGGPALQDLLGVKPGDPAVNRWFSVIIAVFLVGAASGGVLFGWLGDKIGRVRAMSLSIFTYAIFTGLCGLATEGWHLAGLRFIASLGMGGEWSLGVALVIEIWPDRSRAWLAGAIGAAANVGFLLVGFISLGLGQIVESLHSFMIGLGLPRPWIESLLANSAWRFLMISGALPALLIFFIRLFVPESERWTREKKTGSTTHWVTSDLAGVALGSLGALLVIWVWSPAVSSQLWRTAGSVFGLTVAVLGYLYPVRQYLRRAEAANQVPSGSTGRITRLMLLGTGLAGVALLGTWGSVQWAPKWASELSGDPTQFAKEYTQIASGAGAIVGTITAALIAGRLGRRMTYTVLCLGTIAAALFFYNFNRSFGPVFLVSIFLLGGMSAGFYGFFPLYFPELFPTKVRATAQGFAYNFGRVIAAVGTLQTATLIGLFHGSFAMAGSVLSAIYLIGAILIWLAPETKNRPLPD